MSDLPNFNRRKKDKTDKSKTSTKSKQRKTIRKSRLTREYQNTEKEVQVLLENSSLTIDISSSLHQTADNESQSINFFCGTSEEETARTTERTLLTCDELPILSESKISEAEYEGEGEAEEDDIDDDNEYLPESESMNGKTTTNASRKTSVEEASPATSHDTQAKTTASSYIQIVIDQAVITQQSIAQQFQPDMDLLYQPDKKLNLNIKLNSHIDVQTLDTSTKQMLNRYHEEAKSKDKKVAKAIIKALQTPQSELDFVEDFQLYRTYCEYRFNPVFCKPARQAAEIPVRKFIKLYLRELRFTKHPQLLDEHLLANKLEQLYDDYAARLKQQQSNKLHAELHAERKIVADLIKRAAARKQVAGQADEALTLERHLLSVKALRKQCYEWEAENKRLLKDILNAWVQLKQQRKAQQYQCTRLKMCLNISMPSDADAERKKWNERFESDLNEIYREELEVYYRTKRQWQADAKKTIRKPTKPDISKLSEDLQKQFGKSFYAPDEPRIAVYKSRLNADEFYNMPGVRKLKSFFMKIYFDEQFVGVTRNYRLDNDLCLYINEAMGIFVERRLPTDVRIALYEKSKLPKPRKVANIYVPIGQQQTNLLNQQTCKIQFSAEKPVRLAGQLLLRFDCDDQIHPSDVLAIEMPTRIENTDAKDSCLTGWWLDKRNKPFHRNDKHEANDSTDDEENPEEAEPRQQQMPLDTCTFEETLLQFCPYEVLEQNSRLRLLRSRYLRNDARTKDIRFIPALDNELEFDWAEQDDVVIDVGNWMDPINVHKYHGKKYLRKLYEAIQIQSARLHKIMANTENLLIGDEPGTWSALFQAMGNIFQPVRPLNPARGSAARTTTEAATAATTKTKNKQQNFTIMLSVMRATGIPIRSAQLMDNVSSPQRSSDGSASMFMTQTFKYANVRPFIVLSYRDKVCRTLTAEGSNPTWNEQLSLNVSFSGYISDLRDDIKILLFDEIIEQQLSDDLSMRNVDIYQRVQTNWLGEYRIPIRALIKNQKFEGVFEFIVPKVLVGYKRPSFENLASQAETNIFMEQYPEIKEAVNLWFFIGISAANIELSQVNTKCLDCSELREVRQTLDEWSMIVREQRQIKRIIEPLVCTMDGKRVCMTRLLEAIPLPIEVSENLLESVCRYVSLLNIPKNYDSCMELDGVWLDNQSVLDTTWCSAKDLGVLLCNYLLTIGLPTWLILGSATPNGDSAYVLYRNGMAEHVLIDPTTGKQYSTKDVLCPLHQIYYVLTKDNIYCNIQSQTRVTMMNFNFGDSSCWLPAFSKRKIPPLGGVQKLNYKYISSFNTNELRKNIERKIMKKINSWRPLRKTIWNRAFQTRLLDTLAQLETLATFGNNSALTEKKLADRLLLEFPHYKIYGFTLNFSYTNLTSVSDRIKATGIHLNSDTNVEYSLAVHINAYTNNILSIWIFLISLIPI